MARSTYDSVYSIAYEHTHTHTHTHEYGLNVRYKRCFVLIEVFNIPIHCRFPHLLLGWVSLPQHQPNSQLIRRVHCVWTTPVDPAAHASLWTRKPGRARLDQCANVWGRRSQSRPRSLQPPCCTLSILLISLHWPAFTSLSAEEISGFFHLLEIKIT